MSQRPFKLKVEGVGELMAETLIISTGASARLLGIPREKENIGRGVSTCATCDGFFYRGKKIIVVGGGDSAIEEANFLTRFASEVQVVHRVASCAPRKSCRIAPAAIVKLHGAWTRRRSRSSPITKV
nr:FAD-dependent oxidoreductase [Paenibacillus alginolyticus]